MPTNFNYNRDIPFATNDPAVDQPDMQTNTNSIDSLINVDHLSFNTATGSQSDGYHKVIHQVPFSTTTSNPPKNNPPTLPAPISGVGEIISVQMNPKTGVGGNADEVLFYQSGGGRYLQLTNVLGGAGNQALAGTNGYTPLLGGIIFQWGEITAINTGITDILFVTANIDFPNTCFTVMAGLRQGSVNTSIVVPGTTSISNKGFRLVTTPGRTDNYVWYAIGN
jgi:hypothetical protein